MDNQEQTIEISTENIWKRNRFSVAGGCIGAVSGIVYAVHNETGFWKGVGYYLLFGLAGSLAGTALDSLTKK